MDETSESVSRFAVKDLFLWKSLNRPEWTFSIEAFRTLGAVALLVSIILLFFQEWLAIVVTWAAFFLFYALTRVAPVEVVHKITNQGINSMDRSYLWSELGPFWFTTKGEDTLLHVAHRSIFGQLIIIIQKEDEGKIRDILAEYLPYIETVEKSPAEKMQEWFSKKFPLEKMVPKNFTAPEVPSSSAPADAGSSADKPAGALDQN